MFSIRTLFRVFLGISLLLLVSNPAVANPQQIEIRVLPDSVVYGENFVLGDIAELDGFDVETIQKIAEVKIGRSPLPGRSIVIRRGQIQSRLKRKFKNYKFAIQVPKRALVSRASLKVSKEQIREIVTQEVKKRYEAFDDVKITIRTRLKDVFIPKGKASFTLQQIGKNKQIGGYTTWKLQLRLDQKVVKQVLVRVKVDVTDEVMVAKGKIQKGRSIESSDLVKIRKDISKERWNYQIQPDLLVGQTARRDILKNEQLRSRLVEAPTVLQKGSPVRLVYKTNNLFLTNIAIALRSGKKGDLIPVRTVKSKKTIYAIVVDSRNVEVVL